MGGGLEKLVNGVRSFEEYKPKLVNGLEDVASAHAGHTTDLLIKKDDTVWKWDAYVGTNGNGSYARPNTADSVTKVEGLRDIAAISHTTEGGKTYFAIKENGTVYGWGRNDHGNLGRSDYKPVSKPAVIPELKDAASIVTGYGSTLIAKKDGTVWTLGLKIGQYLPTLYTDKPKKVEGLENVVSVTLGSDHALAVTKDGDIWSWGDWGTSNKEKPVLVSSADRLRFEK